MLVAKEKRRVIARERVLTWTDPDPRGVDAIGGLELLKEWLAARRLGFGAKARAFGLPAPNGANAALAPQLGDGVNANDVPFLPSFPYVATPGSGFDSVPHP